MGKAIDNSSRYFFLEDAGPKKPPRELWALDVKAKSAPVYRDGRVYISQEKKYLALDARTGKTIWAVDLPGQGSGPAFDGDRILVGGNYIDQHLYAFEAATGKELGRYRTVSISAPVHATPVVADGKVIFAAGKTVIALDANTLKKAWSAPLGKKVGYEPVIVADGLVFVSTDEGMGKSTIFAVALQDGAEAWKMKAPNLRSNLACVDKTIFYTDEKAGFHRVDSASGKVVESANLLEGADRGRSYLASDGELLLVTFDYNLYACHVPSRKWLWSIHSNGVIGQPVIADGCVYFANCSDSLFGLDLKTGKELYKVKTGVRSKYACGVGDGLLIMAGSMTENRLMAFE